MRLPSIIYTPTIHTPASNGARSSQYTAIQFQVLPSVVVVWVDGTAFEFGKDEHSEDLTAREGTSTGPAGGRSRSVGKVSILASGAEGSATRRRV